MVTDRHNQSIDEQSDQLRVGLGNFVFPDEDHLQFAKQLGVGEIVLNLYHDEVNALSVDGRWEFDELLHLRNRVADAGLRLAAIENLPRSFYDRLILGRDGREQQLENVKETIRNIGRAGIPILGYHWMPRGGASRTSLSKRVRGDARSTAFNHDQAKNAPLVSDRVFTEDELWGYYEYFIDEIVPVAEEADVKLALHPHDPPVKELLGGTPQIFSSLSNYKRAIDYIDSDHHGIILGLGNFSAMGEDVVEVTRYFGDKGKIMYVHFRDVEGTVPSFHETFIDEGNFDEFEVIRCLSETEFDGIVIPDHVPSMKKDAEWRHPGTRTVGGYQGRSFTVGYLKGMITALNHRET